MPNTIKTPGNNDMPSLIDDIMSMDAARFLAWLRIDSAEKHQQVLSVMDYLMMNTPDSPDNPYNDLMLALTRTIQAYEAVQYDISPVDPVDLLCSLMADHRLRQSDLPEIGPQSKVSEILNRKKALNVRQIKGLANRFNLSPAAFLAG